MWLQIEGTKLIFTMNFSVLDFFKFASRMLQIAQILGSVVIFCSFIMRRCKLSCINPAHCALIIIIIVIIITIIIIIKIMIINLIYIAHFDTNGILTALYIVRQFKQMWYVHIWTYMKQSYSYTYTCPLTHIHTPTGVQKYIKTYWQDYCWTY